MEHEHRSGRQKTPRLGSMCASRSECSLQTAHLRPRDTRSRFSPSPRSLMPRDDLEVETERELSAHIFSVSAQLVGICLTVLGLFRVMIRLRTLGRIADNLLALDAVAF